MKVGYESGIGAWYDKHEFEKACGTGSYPEKNRAYCNQLITTLDGLDVKTVVDYGCGNHQSYKGHIDWANTKYDYIGYDAHRGCVDTLRKKYPKLRFEYADLNVMPEPADVIVVKDVLIHWFNKDIEWFFENVFDNFKYVIYMHSTTNQGYKTRVPKREAYMIDNPEKRFGTRDELPEGAKFWDEGCFGYKCVPSELLPTDKIEFKTNIMGDSMKTFILFKS
jgi:hypothetical protein